MSSHRKLSDLRLTDLKQELEKRGLDTTGNKSVLHNRLEEALIAEGNNPNDYMFNAEDVDGERHDSENLARNDQQTGDLFVHDDYEETDFLADSGGGRRNHASTHHPLERSHSDSPSSQDPTNTADISIGGDGGAGAGPGGDSMQNAANGGDEENVTAGSSATAKEATAASGDRAAEDLLLENLEQDELNRSREFIRSSKIPKETDEEKAKSRNLWVSNLSSRVKAQDLTTMFSKYGPTDGAKVIISNRDQDSPYGFVTMATVEAADECVKQLDGTEWNGKNIKVEKIARDPTSSANSSAQQNGSTGESKNRRNVSGARRSGGASRIAASDRRRLGAKGGEVTAVSSTTEDPTKGGSTENTTSVNDATKNEAPESEAGGNKEKNIDYYKRKARHDYEIIRDLESQLERNRRRQNFLIQREREKANRIEAQCRNTLRRERDLLASERDLLDKRRSDLDRLEKALVDRERMLKERERHLDEKDRDYLPPRQSNSSRQPTTLSASTYGPSQQSAGRYYSNPPVSSSSTASKRPYEGGSSWSDSKRMNSRSDYQSGDRQSSNSQSYGGGNSSSYRSGNSNRRDYDDRGNYGDDNYGGRTGGSGSRGGGGGGRRWADRGSQSGGVSSSSVAHWVKPVNHRPPFVGGAGDVDSSGGGDSSWSRNMQGGGSTRRF